MTATTLAVVSFASAAWAAAPDTVATMSRSSMSAASCPALFGGVAVHRENRARRAALLYWIAADRRGVTVAHASDRWQRPAPLSLQGLRVVGAAAGSHARVVVAPALAARVGCVAGTYRLGRDMSIGGAAVLGVLAEGLLIERRGRLGFVGRAGARRPDWLMVWGSPYKVASGRAASAAPGPALTTRSPYRAPTFRPRSRHRIGRRLTL